MNAWREHLLITHSLHWTNTQFQAAAVAARETRLLPIEHQFCPLCLCVTGKARREFATHVAEHMEKIALVALPLNLRSEIVRRKGLETISGKAGTVKSRNITNSGVKVTCNECYKRKVSPPDM